MPELDRIEILEWILDHRTGDDIVPLHIGITNWVKFPGVPWSADLKVRYDRCPAVDVELVIRCADDGYLADVRGERVEQPMKARRFSTFHAAQLAAEKHALLVAHLIPVSEQEPSP